MFLSQSLLETLEHEIRSIAGRSAQIILAEPVSGGDSSRAYRIRTDKQVFFAKINSQPDAIRMFIAESAGLSLLRRAVPESIPTVYSTGQARGEAFLLMEWIESGSASRHASEALGVVLAEVHRQTQPAFGLDHDNFIGSLPQSNASHPTWTTFFIHERLEKQVQHARNLGLLSTATSGAFQTLYGKLGEIFPNEPPALVHGDLWAGNYLIAANGQPMLIDPAVHYGNREADIAMTYLFGGFDPYFYDAYQEAYPLQAGWQKRVDLYNLYPLLVHLNLFGGAYLRQIETILRRFA